MESILNWGIDVVLWCQQFSPALDTPFRIFTFTGDEMFFLLFLPLIYWSIDKHIGIRITILFLFSSYINNLVKSIFKQPRPFQLDHRVKSLVSQGGYGFPSGHTQETVVIWGFLATCFQKTWVRVLAIIMIIMVPLSRIYLGVHFPTDIIGGYILGLLVIGLYFKIEPPVVSWLTKRGLPWHIAISVIVPSIMLILLPEIDSNAIATCATLMGAGIGLSLENITIHFQTQGSWWQKVLRYVIGLVLLLIVYVGLKKAFAGLEPVAVFRFIRYGLIGFSVVFIAPWIFIKAKIAEQGGVSL